MSHPINEAAIAAGACEETLAAHGAVSEPIATGTAAAAAESAARASGGRRKRSELWTARRLGLHRGQALAPPASGRYGSGGGASVASWPAGELVSQILRSE